MKSSSPNCCDLIGLLLLSYTKFCLAKWEDAYENVCDDKGCSYIVRVGKIVDKINHEILFEWEWEGYYSVNLDDDSNQFKFGHEICVDTEGCEKTFVCAQVEEMIQSESRDWVDLVVSGRIEMDGENIYTEDDMKFRFASKNTSLSIPMDIERFLIDLGY